jgi:hypothetical protein
VSSANRFIRNGNTLEYTDALSYMNGPLFKAYCDIQVEIQGMMCKYNYGLNMSPNERELACVQVDLYYVWRKRKQQWI